MDIDSILNDSLEQSRALAETLFKRFANQAAEDTREFFENSRESLERAALLLAEGRIDPDDFEDLVRGKRDLAEMRALKQAGLAKATIDTFTNGVLQIFMNAVLAAV